MKQKKTIGRAIKTARTKAGLSQLGLAKKSGISQEWLCRIEGGHRVPETGTIIKLARALGIQAGTLLEGL